MNRSLSPSVYPKYTCKFCHREIYSTRGGYLPIHRIPRKRARCDDGSNSPVSLHKKVTP